MPDEMSIQLPYVRRLMEAMNLPILELDGYEADDVIGTMAKLGKAKNLEVLVVSNDKDMMQLVNAGVKILRTGTGGAKADTIVDAKKVEEILGVTPDKVIDLMALLGDTVDNIPGAKGIGDKGATELIQKYGSVENALEHAAEVPNKRYREALQQQVEQVKLSKQLAAIEMDVPLELDTEKLKARAPDVAALTVLYRELGFNSLLKELLAVGAAPQQSENAPATLASAAVESATAQEPKDYAQLANAEDFRVYLKKLAAKDSLAIWLNLNRESAGRRDLGRGSPRSKCRQRRAKGARCGWTKRRGAESAGAGVARQQAAKDRARPETVPVIGGQDGKHRTRHAILFVFVAANDREPQFCGCNLPAIQCANGRRAGRAGRLSATPGAGAAGADGSARFAEGVRTDRAAAGCGTGGNGARGNSRRPQSAGENVGVNGKGSAAHREGDLVAGRRGVQPEFADAACGDSVRQIEFAAAGASRWKVRSTAADILETMSAQHELPRKMIEYREIAKLKSIYVDALPELIHPETGRLHTSFSQTVAATGRLSSSDPNVQNIPIRSELGREIRAAFVADRGKLLLSADYSQIELRVMAHFSQDPVLIAAFRNGEDIHARTAQEVFGVGPMAQTAEHRRAAKAINFGIIYGLSAFGLAQQLGIEQREAAQFINAYFARYRGVKEYLDRVLVETRQSGVARTLFGRIRPIPDIVSPQVQLRNFAERTALNSPLQGTAADLIKLAMISIDKRLAKEKLQAQMILQVHDELLFEAPIKELKALEKLVKEEMEGVYKLAVPLVVEIGTGPNWRDLD
jgi:DNA polymerase-1